MNANLPDDPSGAALLDVARRALLDEVAPALTGRQRFVVLMAANAVGIAMREIANADAVGQVWRRALAPAPDGGEAAMADRRKALAAAIRAGRHDADTELYAALRGTTELAARIYKPGSSEEKAKATA